ncbi:MAG: 3-hydroxyacyl-CoA dehydrogenase family protein [Planctomycetes bacterium]|nr:3-hydroxyacyl-CoA dehydrogenase family protein [Planctomycetota bacterium]
MSDIRQVAVVGAGTMGHGIAYVAALSGYVVRLTDALPAALDKARVQVAANLKGGMERGKLKEADRTRVEGNLSCEPNLARAVAGADLVVEAVVENLEVKQALFRDLARLVPSHAILATNTSSLPVGRLAQAVAPASRVIGMHFFNPVHLMPLVEIVVHAGTDDATREAVLGVARRMGKEPIVVKDSPGFASSRLGVVLGLEAMRMVEQGVASVEDIDKAMELGYRHPMGPLKLTDLVGLDVRLAIAEILHGELGGEQYRPPQILRKKVAAGELGKKSGQGFYKW